MRIPPLNNFLDKRLIINTFFHTFTDIISEEMYLVEERRIFSIYRMAQKTPVKDF